MLKIKELRQEKGISQDELAKAINVRNYNIGDWERERTQPSIENLTKLADYFEVSTDYLIGRSNDIGIIEINQSLAPIEIELLTIFRQLDYRNQNQIIGFAKGLTM